MSNSVIARRTLLGAGMAVTAGGALARRSSGPLTMMLLGQSLIQEDLCALPWRGRTAIEKRLHTADIVFTDLETAVRGPGAGPPTRSGLVFHAADASAVGCLKKLGVSIVTTANNHAWDLGPGGILAGVRILDSLDIAHTGSGADLAAACRPAVQRTRHGTVALVAGATGAIMAGGAATATRPGVNELRMANGELDASDVGRMLTAITNARRSGATVIACLHNHHWQPDPAETPPWQRRFARSCVDAGAAVFVSHGPPLLQGVEVYRGAPLFHGLGSFIFQTRKTGASYSAANWQSVMVAARFDDGRFVDATLAPIVLDATRQDNDAFTAGTPTIAYGDGARAILDRFAALSRSLGVSVAVSNGHGVLEPGS